MRVSESRTDIPALLVPIRQRSRPPRPPRLLSQSVALALGSQGVFAGWSEWRASADTVTWTVVLISEMQQLLRVTSSSAIPVGGDKRKLSDAETTGATATAVTVCSVQDVLGCSISGVRSVEGDETEVVACYTFSLRSGDDLVVDVAACEVEADRDRLDYVATHLLSAIGWSS